MLFAMNPFRSNLKLTSSYFENGRDVIAYFKLDKTKTRAVVGPLENTHATHTQPDFHYIRSTAASVLKSTA